MENNVLFSKKRWLILAISVAINLCIGFAYAWSVFQKPLMELFGWSASQASMAFTVNLFVLPIAMIFSGIFVKKFSVKHVVIAGGIIFGCGLFLTGFTTNIYMLYITYGVIAGSGIGLIYSCTVANTIKWFPDKKGLTGGLAAGGFGAGSLIFAPLAVKFIGTFGVLSAFQILGALFGGIILILGFFLETPPEFQETDTKARKNKNFSSEISTRKMLKTPDFYIIWILMVLGCISGLMIISQASPIAQVKVGLSPELAAFAVGFLGLANAIGRVVWGLISDKLGRYNTLIAMFTVSGVGLLILYITSGLPLFMIAICLIAASYGGVFGLFPSLTADNFGMKFLSMNYGVVMTGLSIGAVIGPKIAAYAVDSSGGSYDLAFMITLAINIIAILLVLIAKRIKNKKNRATALIIES